MCPGSNGISATVIVLRYGLGKSNYIHSTALSGAYTKRATELMHWDVLLEAVGRYLGPWVPVRVSVRSASARVSFKVFLR